MAEAALSDLLDLLNHYTVVDLSHRLEPGIPSYPTHPKYFQMPWRSMGDPAEFNQLVLGEHTGTHVDSPSHFVPDLNDPARKHIDEYEPTVLIGRAATVTLGPFEPNNAMVGRDAFEAWEREHGPINAGDIVLCNFQWASRWRTIPEGFEYLQGWPGMARDAAEYLAEKGVRAVGTDCVGMDAGDGGRGELPAHYVLLPRGVLIMENLANLGQLPPFSIFMALPLKIANGTGSPLRAIAFVPR